MMFRFSIVMFLCFMHGLFAFKVNPMQMELSPKDSQGFFTVVNNSDKEEVVLVKAKTRMIDMWGHEENGECDEFVIYPSHLVLKAGEQRLVRLIWKNAGKEKLSMEKNYRMIFEQSLVNIPKSEIDIENMPEAKTSIGFGIKYVASLYVKPHDKVKPKIAVLSHSFEKKDGCDVLCIEIENQGTKHKVFSPRTMEINLEKQEGKETKVFAVPDELISRMDKGINVLAGQKRMIEIPVNEAVPRNIARVLIID